jgi:hypothetical protein
MGKGFKVSDAGLYNEPMGTTGVVSTLHRGLDILLEQIKDNDLSGCKITLTAVCGCGNPEHEEKEFTLSVYESTGQKDCVWCNGTGVEGS